MKRNSRALAFILLLALFSFTQCNSSKITLASTYWRYTDEDLSYEVYFKPDGHIYSYHPDDASPENDFWKQKGKKITMTMNDHYSVYKGKLINDSTLVGQASSPGFKWKWSAKFVSKN